MSMPIECRSSQQILEDDLVDVHTALVKNLNLLCNGRLLYVGEQAKRMRALKERVERAIVGDAAWDSRLYPSAYYAACLR